MNPWVDSLGIQITFSVCQPDFGAITATHSLHWRDTAQGFIPIPESIQALSLLSLRYLHSAARFLAAPDDHRITQAYSTWVWCVIPLIAQARRLGYPASAHILMCFVATVSAFLTVYTSTIQFWGKWNSCGWFEGTIFLIFSLPFGHWLQSLTATGKANELIQDIKSRRVSGHGNIPLPAMSGRARWRGHRGTFYFCSFGTRQVIIWSLKGATGIMKTNLMVLRCEKSVPIRLAFWVMAKVYIYIKIRMYA